MNSNFVILLILITFFILFLIIIFLLKRPREGYVKVESIFTQPELKFYKILFDCFPEYVIFGKVRVADIINVDSRKAKGKYLKYFNKISRKHIDFLICDREKFSPLVAIELDDSTHEREERIERDKFLDKVFKMADLPLVRFKVKRNYNAEEIRRRIKDAMQ